MLIQQSMDEVETWVSLFLESKGLFQNGLGCTPRVNPFRTFPLKKDHKGSKAVHPSILVKRLMVEEWVSVECSLSTSGGTRALAIEYFRLTWG